MFLTARARKEDESPNQGALRVTSNNVTNVKTRGYARRMASNTSDLAKTRESKRRSVRLSIFASAIFASAVLFLFGLFDYDPAEAQTADENMALLEYRLGSGDELRVIVFGEDDLSGKFKVSSTGNVSLPLIGQVNAADRTLSEFEEDVESRLRDGYLIDPRVSTEVLNYRPFYIYGEVKQGGEFPYVNGMNVLNAIALAEGYSYRANTKRVFITRKGILEEKEFPASQLTKVLPGDVLRVPERFF